MPEPETNSGVGAYGDPRTIRRLILRHGPTCFYCGRAFSATCEGWSHMAVDHVVAQSKRDEVPGVDQIWNLRLSCRECNSSKGGKRLSVRQLATFRVRRRLRRERDEQWVRWHRQFLRELRDRHAAVDIPDPEALAGRLCDKLNDSEVTSDAGRYTRATTDIWIRFHRKLAESKEPWEWYFCVNHYQLQPHTLGWSDQLLPAIDHFDSMGYFQDEMRCKYVEPFFDPGRGAAIIEREVRAVEAMWALQRRLEAIEGAGGEHPGAGGSNT